MKITRRQLIKLIKESIDNQEEYDFIYLNKRDFSFKKDVTLKKGLTKLTQELALKYYAEDKNADFRGAIYITGQHPTGPGKRGAPVDMGKKIEYGDPILAPGGVNPETGKPIFRWVYPVVANTQVNGVYSGDIYALTDDKREYFLITQDPSLYNKVSPKNKMYLDIGVSIHSGFFSNNCQSIFRRGRHYLGKLDRHLTKIYTHAGIINDPPDYTNFLNSIIK